MRKNKVPRIFRILLRARDLDRSRRFYEALLGTPGRKVAPGRVYFDCGTVILGVLDYSASEVAGLSTPTEALYLSTDHLEEVHARARTLGSLSSELIHNDPSNPAGEIVVRPWGERSFYAADPSGNPLCFVDSETLFTGTARQIAGLQQGTPSRRKATPRREGRRPTRRANR